MSQNVGPDWVIIMGQPMLRTTVRKLIIASVILVVIFATVAYFVVSDVLSESEEALAYEPEKPLDAETFEPVRLTPLEQLLERHLEATGFLNLTSLRVDGVYKTKDLAMGMRLQARAPGLYRQTLNYENVTIDVGMVDEELWLQQTHPVVDLNDATLGDVNRAVLRMECSIPSIAWRFTGGMAKVFLDHGPDELVDGVEYSTIINRSYPDIEIVHYLDAETAIEKRRVAKVKAGGEVFEIELIYGGITEESEYAFPLSYEVKINGDVFYEVEFANFEFNIGLASFLFAEPK